MCGTLSKAVERTDRALICLTMGRMSRTAATIELQMFCFLVLCMPACASMGPGLPVRPCSK